MLTRFITKDTDLEENVLLRDKHSGYLWKEEKEQG